MSLLLVAYRSLSFVFVVFDSHINDLEKDNTGLFKELGMCDRGPRDVRKTALVTIARGFSK